MFRTILQIVIPAAVLISSLGIPHVRAQDNLPNLGRAGSGLSDLDEKKIGRRFIREARGQMNFVEDPELTQYLTDLGHRIARNSDEPDSEFQFYLIRNNELNAFAVPGGHVAVNTGLIMSTESEGELVSVLSHECAHVTQHHLSRMISQTKGQGLSIMGALVAAILLGGGEAGQAAIVAANANAIENQLAYSRGFEREADAIGIQTMARAGYDPRDMSAFFERLQLWARVYDTGAPEFLRTHPLTTDRIADSRVRADNYERVQNPDQSDFFHIRAKIRATFSNDPKATAAQFASNLESGEFENETAERYGYTLALSAAGSHDQALQEIDKLIAGHPNSVRYQIAKGTILMDAGLYDRAIEHFAGVQQRWPDHLALGLYHSSSLIQVKRFAEAKRILKHPLLTKNDDPRIYSLLARAEGEMGNSLVAHQNLAEYHYLRSDLSEALRQLELARKYAGDSEYSKASIEARSQEIKREMEIFEKDS